MLKVLKQMKNTIEAETETVFSKSDTDYLDQIITTADLGNFNMDNVPLRDLVFDAAIALGLLEDAAEAIAYPADPIKEMPHSPKPTDKELEIEYGQLRRNYSASTSCLTDAKYHLIEEISAEGFASAKTRQTKEHYEAEAEEAKFLLNNFKADNDNFVKRFKEKRSKANHKAMWNS